MIIGKIKLGPNSPSWFDSVNNIHLMKPDKAERDITDKHDFDSIQKGIDSGKIIFKPVKKQKEEVNEKPKTKKKKAVKKPVSEQVQVDVHVENTKNDEGSDKE